MKTAIALLVAVVVPFGTVVLAGVMANQLLAIYRQRRSHLRDVHNLLTPCPPGAGKVGSR